MPLRMSERFKELRREAYSEVAFGAAQLITGGVVGTKAVESLIDEHTKPAVGLALFAGSMAVAGLHNLRGALQHSQEAGREMQKQFTPQPPRSH